MKFLQLSLRKIPGLKGSCPAFLRSLWGFGRQVGLLAKEGGMAVRRSAGLESFQALDVCGQNLQVLILEVTGCIPLCLRTEPRVGAGVLSLRLKYASRG